MILVDSSAWIEFDRATRGPVDLRVDTLLDEPGSIATTEPIVGELLAGARLTHDEERLRDLLGLCTLLPLEPRIDLEAGASIYRTCCASGVTPRGLLDCTIAAVAIRHRVPVLSADVDFARIATVIALDLDPATPR